MTKQNRNAAANLRKSDHFTTSVGGNTSHRDLVEILGISDQFSQDQNYFINQIKDLQAKAASLRFQLDQVTVAQNAFTNSLIQSVKGEEEPKEEKAG